MAEIVPGMPNTYSQNYPTDNGEIERHMWEMNDGGWSLVSAQITMAAQVVHHFWWEQGQRRVRLDRF